jgi:hypothetical protein
MGKSVSLVFESLFGCHHSQLSRVFTIKKRTYRVCFGCGREFAYSWELMRRIQPSPRETAYLVANHEIQIEALAS